MLRALCSLLLACACVPGTVRAQDPEADATAGEGEAESEALAVEEPATELPVAVDSDLGPAIRQREAVEPWHAAFGTATGLSSYATTILGFLTFGDRYGWDGTVAGSGCGSGSPVFGTASCNEPSFAHLIAAATTVTLFAVTFTLALFMPDPLDVAGSRGEQGTLLSIHKVLRWVLLGLYVAQTTLGIVAANVELGSFGAQRDLAIAHLTLGTVTMATLTTQGILGSLMEW